MQDIKDILHIMAIGWGTWIRTKEMSDSESDALPLGYTPITSIIINFFFIK